MRGIIAPPPDEDKKLPPSKSYTKADGKNERMNWQKGEGREDGGSFLLPNYFHLDAYPPPLPSCHVHIAMQIVLVFAIFRPQNTCEARSVVQAKMRCGINFWGFSLCLHIENAWWLSLSSHYSCLREPFPYVSSKRGVPGEGPTAMLKFPSFSDFIYIFSSSPPSFLSTSSPFKI